MPLCHTNYKTNILDYCHGLVCIHVWDLEIAIWNPLIRKYKKLPSEPRDYSGSGRPNFAFGHDPHNDDYKVVRIVEFSKEDTPLLDFEVKVHSLRSRCWKKIKEELPMKECSIYVRVRHP